VFRRRPFSPTGPPRSGRRVKILARQRLPRSRRWWVVQSAKLLVSVIQSSLLFERPIRARLGTLIRHAVGLPIPPLPFGVGLPAGAALLPQRQEKPVTNVAEAGLEHPGGGQLVIDPSHPDLDSFGPLSSRALASRQRC